MFFDNFQVAVFTILLLALSVAMFYLGVTELNKITKDSLGITSVIVVGTLSVVSAIALASWQIYSIYYKNDHDMRRDEGAPAVGERGEPEPEYV